jgi:hypothetical protein
MYQFFVLLQLIHMSVCWCCSSVTNSVLAVIPTNNVFFLRGLVSVWGRAHVCGRALRAHPHEGAASSRLQPQSHAL